MKVDEKYLLVSIVIPMLALVPLKDLDHISLSWLLNCVCVSIPKCNRHISVDFIASIYIFFNYFYTYIFMCVRVCLCDKDHV